MSGVRASAALGGLLDELGLPPGELRSRPIGGGHSNLTCLLERGGERVVLRRPPDGPLEPSAHDVVREARVLAALAAAGAPVPAVLAVSEGGEGLGVPFFLMSYVDGVVLAEELPPGFAAARDGGRVGAATVDALVAIHALPLSRPGLGELGRPSGYLERQVRRFSQLLGANAARPLPDLEWLAGWLEDNRPASPPATFVHGDYRLGNLMFEPDAPRLAAVLDWEMATVGDPLADLGYLLATWAEAGDESNPMLDLSRATREPSFPRRAELAARYAESTGLGLDALPWYEVLALWKSAIFLEGSYKRYLAGSTDDPYFARLGAGVEVLGRQARRRTAGI